MKKKLLCLLLALAVVMFVVPLTAFAEGVPEEYRGTYKATTEGTNYPAKIIISENSAYVDIPDDLWDGLFSYVHYIDSGNYKTLTFLYDDLPLDIVFRSYDSYASISSGPLSYTLHAIEKVSDSTNSTLSAGSNWIIPVVAGVLALGVVIYIGKRKKEKTE